MHLSNLIVEIKLVYGAQILHLFILNATIKEINQRRHLRKMAKKGWFLKEKLVGVVLIVRN